MTPLKAAQRHNKQNMKTTLVSETILTKVFVVAHVSDPDGSYVIRLHFSKHILI